MEKYVLRDKEAGNYINEYLTLQDAENSLKDFESIDKANNEFTQDFYEIKEVNDTNTYLTEKQKSSLQEFIYINLVMADNVGLGEIGECRDTAQYIVEEWANDNGIVFID